MGLPSLSVTLNAGARPLMLMTLNCAHLRCHALELRAPNFYTHTAVHTPKDSFTCEIAAVNA